jgi:orotate phosphoribosyltransferase
LLGASVSERMDFMSTLRACGAMREGHFLLSSGRHSAQYIEKFDLLRRPEHTSAACALIAAKFEGERVDVVAGPTTGGVILAFETARQLGAQAAYAERSTEGRTEREFRRGTTFAPGSRVLVVDDILTTGGSVRETLEALRQHPVEVIGVAVLVDRSGGTAEIGAPLTALAQLDIANWETADCPLCLRGEPLVKPGTTPTWVGKGAQGAQGAQPGRDGGR